MCLFSTSFICLPALRNHCAICTGICHILPPVFPDLVFQLSEVISASHKVKHTGTHLFSCTVLQNRKSLSLIKPFHKTSQWQLVCLGLWGSRKEHCFNAENNGFNERADTQVWNWTYTEDRQTCLTESAVHTQAWGEWWTLSYCANPRDQKSLCCCTCVRVCKSVCTSSTRTHIRNNSPSKITQHF